MQAAFFIFSQLGATYPALGKGIELNILEDNEQCLFPLKYILIMNFIIC